GAPVDPVAAEAPQLSVVTGEGLYSSLAEMDPESVLAASRPVSFRMGRHGSSPLNPYTGASSPAVTGSGSIAPPLPTVASGHKQRAGGRRKSQQQQQQQQQRVAQTPLPRRWWRNIKESMYAPIPPLHRPLPPADGPVRPADVSVNGSAGIEGLPARPVRRHSFSGSTDIEQQKMAAALSPRENMRRKVTLVDRVRGLLRGNSRRPQLQQPPPQSVHSASRSQVPMAEHAATIGTSAGAAALGVAAAAASVGGNWGPHNPFSYQSLMGLGRRASFDTLSIHEMAEADRHDMHSRLDHLLGSGSAGAPGSIAASPQLGHTAASSKFSFSALPATPPPKPLPATPRHPSQPQVFTFPAAQPRPIEPSPVFRSEASSQHHPLPVAPVQEMVEKSRPSNIQHFSQDSVHVNAAQVPDSQYPQQPLQQLQQPQQQPQQPQQQPQQQPYYQHSVHDNGAPVVAKRPSLLKRLTAGWRKP
ncbi:hypothetical protein H4S07_006106, partial [Coemansia furcata]